MLVSPVLCFDLGATRLKAGLVAGGCVEAFETRSTRALDGPAALELLADVGGELRRDHDVSAVGVGIPGIVDDGRVVALPGKFDGLVGTDVRAQVRERLSLEALVVNDAVAYGAGEASHGSGVDASRVVVITIGTGVGVTVLEHGRPVADGPLGAGILGGQIPISADDSGPRDTNGRSGTIEARCSAAAVMHHAREAGATQPDIPALYAAHRAGDPTARAAVDLNRQWLTHAIVALAHAHTPDVVVLGGGPMTADSPVLDGLDEAVNERLWPGYETRVAQAVLGDRASLLGLAHLLSQEIDGE